MALKRVKIADLTPDGRNANKGTERGSKALEKSLRDYGAGRSILVDKDGNVIAGNKTLEEAGQIGIDDVIIVETDGRQLVAVKRTDLSIDSPQGRGLAIADNRTGQLNLDWDADVLKALQDEGLDLSAFWREDELAGLLGQEDGGDQGGGGDIPEQYQILIDCNTETEQAALLDRLIAEGVQCRALIS